MIGSAFLFLLLPAQEGGHTALVLLHGGRLGGGLVHRLHGNGIGRHALGRVESGGVGLLGLGVEQLAVAILLGGLHRLHGSSRLVAEALLEAGSGSGHTHGRTGESALLGFGEGSLVILAGSGGGSGAVWGLPFAG